MNDIVRFLISLALCMETHLSLYKIAGILVTVGGVLMVSGSEVGTVSTH